MSVNKVMILGRVGDDVKMHFFEGGGSIGRFPVATNESYTNKSTGEKVEDTEWHNIVVRNKTAEIIEKYVKKGDQIFIEGKIKTRQWEDDSGNKRYSTEIHAFSFSFVGSRSETTRETQNPHPSNADTGGEDLRF